MRRDGRMQVAWGRASVLTTGGAGLPVMMGGAGLPAVKRDACSVALTYDVGWTTMKGVVVCLVPTPLGKCSLVLHTVYALEPVTRQTTKKEFYIQFYSTIFTRIFVCAIISRTESTHLYCNTT